jgi:hypothetical protein
MLKALIAAVIILTITTATAPAQNVSTANYMAPRCLAENTIMQAWCIGNVQAVRFLGSALPAPLTSCVPAGVTHEQTMIVAVRYIQARPQRMHEPFIALATEALAAMWPCKSR